MQRFGVEDASYKAAGQLDGLRQLVGDFYHAMDTLPGAKKIRDMHPADLTESIDKLICFLSGWLGGPRLYQEKYGHINIPQAHCHLRIGSADRDAWLLCMEAALEKQDYTPAFAKYLMRQLAIPAERVRNAS